MAHQGFTLERELRWPAPWSFGAGLAAFALSALFGTAAAAGQAWFPSRHEEVVFGILLAANLLIACALYRFVLARSTEASFWPGGVYNLPRNSWQVAMLLSAAILGSGVLRFWLGPELGPFIQFREWPTGATWISDVVLAPLVEEITFRWILYRTLRTRLGIVTSATLSSAIFALLHLADVQSMIIAFWLGLVLAAGAERFRNLEVLVATHSGYNLIALMLKTA